MNTNIQTVGGAILLQSMIRYGAFIAMTWIAFSFANDWVLAAIASNS